MISVLIPFHNEKENIPLLLARLIPVLHSSVKDYEVLFVDDGSTDGSGRELELPSHVKILRHRRQMGKGAALSTAFQNSKGDVIVFMDSDLEDEPEEIPHFLELLDAGYDFVNGKRIGRQHSGLIRIYSGLANYFIRSFLRSPFHDVNCGFKAMKRPVLDTIPLYGNNFRFLPLAAFYEGFKVTEVGVSHKKRIHGQSKFGAGKVFIGFIDTITAYFIYLFSERPLHFFGILGAVASSLGGIILIWLGIDRIIFNHNIYRRPILFLGMLLVIIGVQIAATGLLGELMVYLKRKKI